MIIGLATKPPVEIPAARKALKEDSLGPPPIIKVNIRNINIK